MLNVPFRKSALEKTNTIESTDELVKIITPPGWISLAGISFLIVVALTWGIFGRVSTNITAQGIILKKGGVFNIVANGSGQVISVLVKKNSHIKEGDVIAIISQPALSEKIKISKDQLAKAKYDYEKEKTNANVRSRVKRDYITKQKETVETNIKNLFDRSIYLQEQVINQQELYSQGLITNEQLENLKQESNTVKSNLQQAKSQVIQYEYELLDLENQTDKNLDQYSNRIREVQQSLQVIESEYEITSKVVSSFNGAIVEIKVYEGSTITQGTPIASVESNQKGVQAVIYLSPFEGKKIKEGMSAQVVPSNIAREEFGYINAQVTDVSRFPLTTTAMQTTLDNDGLINLFSKDGPPIAVTLTFITAVNTGKYLWSSNKGQKVDVTPGTLCNCNVAIKQQRPITLILPFLESVFNDK
ncbi:MAG: NHLP bacteriocin system secretion protein [Melioribacteraceae bacterium]